MEGDELAHMIRHLVSQAMQDQRPFLYGHIASYDPAGHKVRCIIPSMQDEQGLPLLSPWMPMGTLSAGAGYGMQIVYRGGATVQNPTGGEQVLVGRFDQSQGVTAVPAMHYNDQNLPPATKLPEGAPPAAPGDVLISNPSNTLLRMHPNGDFEVFGTGKFIVTVTGDANVTTQGNATVTATGTATIIAPVIKLTKALADTLHFLCNDLFRGIYNTHFHGVSGPPPTPQADATTITSVVQAE